MTRTEGPFGATTPILRETFPWDNLDRISSRTTETNAQAAVVFASDFRYDDRSLMVGTDRLDASGNATLTSDYSLDDAGFLESLVHFEPASMDWPAGDQTVANARNRFV